MTWAHENPVSIRTLDPRGARGRALDPRGARARDIWQATNELYLWFAQRGGGARVPARPRRGLPARAPLDAALPGPGAQHDAARRADGLPLAGRAARARRPDRAHPGHAPPHARGRGRAAPARSADRALAVAAARLLRASRRSCAAAGARQPRGAVVSFLLFETRFPRSLRYCVQSALKVMARHLGRRPTAPTPPTPSSAWPASTPGWASTARAALPRSIHELLTHVIDEIARVCGAVQQNIFGERAAPPQKLQAQQ